MDELFPDWKKLGAPLDQAVTGDDVLFLSETGSLRAPDWIWCRATCTTTAATSSACRTSSRDGAAGRSAGRRNLPGLCRGRGAVRRAGMRRGVATGNMGITKEGEPGENFQLGMELRGRTRSSPRARGPPGRSCSPGFGADRRTRHPDLRHRHQGAGELPADKAQPGRVVHTAGWPMAATPSAAAFSTTWRTTRSRRFVIGPDYANPYLSPFEEMQRWKTHPAIRAHIEGGKRIGYGARAINNGTPQALPKTVFPGGALIGCDAGYLNAARIRAATRRSSPACSAPKRWRQRSLRAAPRMSWLPPTLRRSEKSWFNAELLQTRNFKLWFKKGKTVGQVMTGVEQWLLPKLGVTSPPWTLHNHGRSRGIAAGQRLPAHRVPEARWPVELRPPVVGLRGNTNHEENQPAHLTLKDATVPVRINLSQFGGPESRYSPRACTNSCRTPTAATGCRSTRRTACTARPATSRTPRRTSSG